MANKTADERATAYVRRLRLGDIIIDDDGEWEVAGEPKVRYSHVTVGLRPHPYTTGVRSKRYRYPRDHRVKLSR